MSKAISMCNTRQITQNQDIQTRKNDQFLSTISYKIRENDQNPLNLDHYGPIWPILGKKKSKIWLCHFQRFIKYQLDAKYQRNQKISY